MYRVIEVARMLGVSKVTIYKKMRYLKDEIKPYVVKEKNITHITGEGVELIKSTIQVQDYEKESKDSLKLLEAENKISELEKKLSEEKQNSLELDKNNKALISRYKQHLQANLASRKKRLNDIEIELKNSCLFSDELNKQINLFNEINKQSQ